LLLLLFAGTIALTPASTAHGSPLTLIPTNRGHYNESGAGVAVLAPTGSSSTANYAIGDPISDSSAEGRGFFVFDLAAVGGNTIIAAELRLDIATDGFGTTQSPDGTETFDVVDFTNTNIPDLISGVNPAGSFADLGSGNVYATRTVSDLDDSSTLVVTLNAAALSALNTSTGLFAFGTAVTTLAPGFVGQREQIFGSSGPGDNTHLVLELVPEPASFVPLAVGTVLVSLGRGRRRA
jgi:hypothetical protein